jgi:hypothetical protein
MVEDQDGAQLKTFKIRRPSAVSVVEPGSHQTGRGSIRSLEQRISEVLLRRSSTQQILSYVRRSLGEPIKEDKGKTVVR